jgi:hypothetical protein
METLVRQTGFHSSTFTLLLGLSVLFSPTQLFSQTGDGQIQGTILASDGQPVPRASVTAQRQRSTGEAPFRASAFTGTDGSFVVSGVPPGVYRVCIQVPGTTFLNPCTWSVAPPSATVTSGQTSSVGTIQLETGYLVKARLNDSGRLLQSDEGRVPGARVQVGVWTPNGFFLPLRVRTRSATSRDLELPVPFGASVELSASSSFYDLANENNARIDTNQGARIPIQAVPGTQPGIHTFHLTGRRTAP